MDTARPIAPAAWAKRAKSVRFPAMKPFVNVKLWPNSVGQATARPKLGLRLLNMDIPRSMTTERLTDFDYQERTNLVLSAIETQFDRWLDGDVIDVDSRRSGGVLELAFPNGSKIILNTQAPLQELWLAARAGGFHFRFDGQVWRDTREGSELFTCLSKQVSAQAGVNLVLHSPS
jgi:CyaY protein